ncbi:hypothetical protein H6G64_31910 [Calothrix sp. FACHB-156]|nr:hypothetical protein [Calothrix sp. FACHB-156]
MNLQNVMNCAIAYLNSSSPKLCGVSSQVSHLLILMMGGMRSPQGLLFAERLR